MSSFRTALAAALAVALLPAAPRAETLSGAVDFTGTPPVMPKLDREADAFCAKKQMTDEAVLVRNKKLVNVWVHVVKGAPDSKAAEGMPPVVVNQTDCMYRPRVQFALVGQTVMAKNGDPILHNVHTYLGPATLFNKGMPNADAKPISHVAGKNGVIRWKCDVHEWMRAYIGVNKNPFQAITGDDGTFKIDGIPPGTYTLEAWHEVFGAKTLEVTVEAGKPASATFKFDGTEKAPGT
jgi:plastocyanin